MMHWGENVRLALWAVRVDKLKAFLTMLGVMIGSAAIVLVVTTVPVFGWIKLPGILATVAHPPQAKPTGPGNGFANVEPIDPQPISSSNCAMVLRRSTNTVWRLPPFLIRLPWLRAIISCMLI